MSGDDEMLRPAHVASIEAFKARRLQEKVDAIRMVDIEDHFVAREAVSYGVGNGKVAVFGHWAGEEIGVGMTADQARELGLALIGAAALATSEFRALVEQREEKDG